MVNRISWIALTAAMSLSACDADIVPPQIDQSFFYLILEPGGIWDGLGTFNHYAIAATIVRADDVQCRSVQRISLSSVPDNSPFAVRIDGACQTIFGNPSIPSDRCCTIPGSAPPDSLGALDLRYRGSYALEVETEGAVIRGNVTVPDSFRVSVADDGGTRTLHWPRVHGAAGYEIALDASDVIRQPDTTMMLASDYRGAVRILALDPNLWSYLVDPQVQGAGIDAGSGVFGAISAAPRIDVPEPVGTAFGRD